MLRKILLLGILFLVLFCSYIFISFETKDIEPNYSKATFDRNGEILSIMLNNSEQWHLKEDGEIGEKLKRAIILFEDKNFEHHFGIDFMAIARSAYNNATTSKRSGASTISMQTIKLLTNMERTYFNKFKEAIQTLKLEFTHSKNEILLLYANNAPYGGNIVGVKTAALFYFNKKLNNLTWSEAALLAVLPNAPGLIHLNRNTDTLMQKRNSLLRKLRDKGYIDKDIYTLAINEPLPNIKRNRNIAPHLSLKLAKNSNETNIHTTIDKYLQSMLEKELKIYAKEIKSLDIENTAGIIVDTKSREILAYGGSQDFFDIDGGGQIDGVSALRSPGSTLKPLLYALSIDEGIISQDSKLIDAPTFFSNFNPKNASKKYYGLISAKEALIKSLNVPFVGLLQDYGYERFFYILKEILSFSDNDFERYGLSLILGTKEISMIDIATLYAGLGNYGEFANLKYTPKQQYQVKKILSSGSAFLSLKAMKMLDRVGVENLYKNKNAFSWKTGTSYGKKDAWAAGTSPKYTIVVWAGNFSGKSNPNISGIEIAAPLLFNILKKLGDTGGDFNIDESEIKYIEIDAPTGYRYDETYHNIAKSTTIYPKNAKTLRKSPFLKNVFISNEKIVDSTDKAFISAQQATKLDLPSNLLEYYKEQKAKTMKKTSKSIKILYPKNNIKIIQTKDFTGDNELIIRIANLNDNEVFWYIDREFIASGKENTKAIKLESGAHNIYIIDSNGESDSVNFIVDK